MIDPVTNFANVEVSTTYNDTATSITLTTGEASIFPDPAVDGEFNVTWWDSFNYGEVFNDPNVEIVRVTATTGDVMTVTRAQEGTVASTKNTGDGEYRMVLAPTKKTIDDIRLDIEDLMPQNYETRMQEDSGNINLSYVGKSDPGSITSASTWQIQIINETTGVTQEWADGDTNFDNIWDDRESLFYS